MLFNMGFNIRGRSKRADKKIDMKKTREELGAQKRKVEKIK